MIKKEKFVEYANVLREHYSWLNILYDMGINIESEAMVTIGDVLLYEVMLEGNMDYDYDDYGGVNWVAYWCSSNEGQKGFRRVKEHIYLPDASTLYDFVTEMAEKGWPERVDSKWIV